MKMGTMLELARCYSLFKKGNWTPELTSRIESLAERNHASVIRYLTLTHSLATRAPSSALADSIRLWSEELAQKKHWHKTDLMLLKILSTHISIRKDWQNNTNLINRISKDRPAVLSLCPAVLNELHQRVNKFESGDEGTYLEHDRENAVSLISRIRSIDKLAITQGEKSIAVVGNSPGLLAHEYGKRIDDSCWVMRFNNVVLDAAHIRSTGKKTDTWVVNPGFFTNNTVNFETNSLLISGYYPYLRPSSYWKQLESYCKSSNKTLINLNPNIWYELVAQLHAPPSAGLLCLTALAKHSIKTQITAYGFTLEESRTPDPGAQGVSDNRDREITDKKSNHYGDKVKKSSRHNWKLEEQLLKQLSTDRMTFK